MKIYAMLTTVTIGVALASACRAGQEVKWPDVPEAVRHTVLANGGKDGQSVDREGGKIDGKEVYETGVKDKETLSDGSIEFKYYAPGVGVVREAPSTGDELLISHAAGPALLK